MLIAYDQVEKLGNAFPGWIFQLRVVSNVCSFEKLIEIMQINNDLDALF